MLEKVIDSFGSATRNFQGFVPGTESSEEERSTGALPNLPSEEIKIPQFGFCYPEFGAVKWCPYNSDYKNRDAMIFKSMIGNLVAGGVMVLILLVWARLSTDEDGTLYLLKRAKYRTRWSRKYLVAVLLSILPILTAASNAYALIKSPISSVFLLSSTYSLMFSIALYLIHIRLIKVSPSEDPTKWDVEPRRGEDDPEQAKSADDPEGRSERDSTPPTNEDRIELDNAVRIMMISFWAQTSAMGVELVIVLPIASNVQSNLGFNSFWIGGVICFLINIITSVFLRLRINHLKKSWGIPHAIIFAVSLGSLAFVLSSGCGIVIATYIPDLRDFINSDVVWVPFWVGVFTLPSGVLIPFVVWFVGSVKLGILHNTKKDPSDRGSTERISIR